MKEIKPGKTEFEGLRAMLEELGIKTSLEQENHEIFKKDLIESSPTPTNKSTI